MNTLRRVVAWARRIANRRQLGRGLFGLVIGALIASPIAFFAKTNRLLGEWELTTVDMRIRAFRHPERASNDLVVITIDDAVEYNLHQSKEAFPPRRLVLSKLVDTLETLGARAIVFDYLFDAEPVMDDAGRPLNPFMLGDANDDFANETRALLQSIWAPGNVVFGVRTQEIDRSASAIEILKRCSRIPELDEHLKVRLPPLRVVSGRPAQVLSTTPSHDVHLIFPSSHLLGGARAFGLTDVGLFADSDGVARSFKPFAIVDDFTLPSLAVAGFVVAESPAPGIAPEWAFDNTPPPLGGRAALAPSTWDGSTASIAGSSVPVRDDGSAWIRWHGDWMRDPQLLVRTRSAWPYLFHSDEILTGMPVTDEGADPAAIRGKVVLIGYTVHGSYTDKGPTPFGDIAGVYSHAAMLDTLLTHDYLRSVPRWLDALLVLAVGLTVGSLALGLPVPRVVRRGGQTATFLWQVVMGSVPVLAFVAFEIALFPAGWVANVFPSALTGVFALAAAVILDVTITRRGEERARELASRALSPHLVARYEREHDGIPPLGGERVNLTVYFSDIAGFTTISEKLKPEELIGILNEYLTRVTELIETRHHAYLDKYIGDAVMAFWGAPEPAERGPLRACLAALDTMASMEEYSKELVARGLAPLKTRIGINSGPAVAGAVGHPKGKLNYTALGDTVNLASRLEGANKAYGTRCMIGEETYEGAKDVVLARELDLIKVKGKKIAVRVYELIGRLDEPLVREREIKRRYEAALARYRNREFEAARVEFSALVTEFGDSPSETLVRSCTGWLGAPPPPDWDGSSELHEK